MRFIRHAVKKRGRFVPSNSLLTDRKVGGECIKDAGGSSDGLKKRNVVSVGLNSVNNSLSRGNSSGGGKYA